MCVCVCVCDGLHSVCVCVCDGVRIKGAGGLQADLRDAGKTAEWR